MVRKLASFCWVTTLGMADHYQAWETASRFVAHDACPAPAFYPTEPPRTAKVVRHCNYCGSTKHLMRSCTFGSSLRRDMQFLFCAPHCFARRFVVPLHRARTDFTLDDLRNGRIDLAAQLVCSALICSQRLRHNAQLWLPFLGDESPTTICVTGGLVRGLHPSELSTARRLRAAIDRLSATTAVAGATSEEEYDLRGFRTLAGDFEVALHEALTQARDDHTEAPLLLMVQGAPPLARVLREHVGGRGAALRDLVVVCGDSGGLSDDEVALVHRLGASAGGGGPVLCASLGSGCLMASQVIVLVNHYLDAIHDCPSQLWPPSVDVRRACRHRGRYNARRGKRRGAPGEAGGAEDDDDGDGCEEDGSEEEAGEEVLCVDG